LEEGYLPPVTFIVVQKRHHTRFCPKDHHSHKQTDRRGNILPGKTNLLFAIVLETDEATLLLFDESYQIHNVVHDANKL
jgi:hypothetical protein